MYTNNVLYLYMFRNPQADQPEAICIESSDSGPESGTPDRFDGQGNFELQELLDSCRPQPAEAFPVLPPQVLKKPAGVSGKSKLMKKPAVQDFGPAAQSPKTPEGEIPEGEIPEAIPKGAIPEEPGAPEGEIPEGEIPEGEIPEGESPEGEITEEPSVPEKSAKVFKKPAASNKDLGTTSQKKKKNAIYSVVYHRQMRLLEHLPVEDRRLIAREKGREAAKQYMEEQ